MKKELRNSEEGGFEKNRLFSVRLLPALLMGKLLILLTRLLGRGGTTLPGRVALKINPKVTDLLAKGLTKGTVLVTGTNGKTTTAALIHSILSAAGYRCIHNQAGSNLAWGVASALIGAAGAGGQIKADYAVLEVDEGAFPGMVQATDPVCLVVTNVFRDQLDRYGEIDYIRAAIGRGLEAQRKDGLQVINADEPSLTGLVRDSIRAIWTYGMELELPEGSFKNTGRDIKSCPLCGDPLDYDRLFYAHLGHYRCPRSHYRRPEPEVKLVAYDERTTGEGAVLTVQLPDRIELKLQSPLPGTYNLYNVLAALTCAAALKIEPEIITGALEKTEPSFGRMEQFEFEGKKLTLALIKNPVGANEVLRTVMTHRGRINLLVAINDKIADGRDVSWLWDVDFEQLEAAGDKLRTAMVSGIRAWDMAVRLKYAGLEPDRITVIEETERAVKAALEKTDPGETLFVLPSYTVMLEIRKALNRLGLGKPYWES